MNVDKLKKIISNGEGLTVEFKEAKAKLPKNVFETVIAFLNNVGGDLILGVDDDGNITGIDKNKIAAVKNELITLSNNPQKIDFPFMLSPEEFEINNKKILYVRVPQSSQVHKSKGVVFFRNGDGDFKLTTHNSISSLYSRKFALFSENKIYPYVKFSDFNTSVFIKAKNLIRSYRQNHPWLSLSNREMLSSSGLFKKDFETGKEGYTLASVLLFGKDEVIQQILPYYKIDALVKIKNLDRYDDRREIRTNLIDAYIELMNFTSRWFPDKFFMEGDIRIDLREKIFREVIANLLVH